MSDLHLDTHVVAWIFSGQTELIPRAVRERIEASDLFVSPAVVLELQYLHEAGRTAAAAEEVMSVLGRKPGILVADDAFRGVVSRALTEAWTRDPFDRLIVAHAALAGADLLTKDRTIRKHYRRAVWDR